jgi:hypothetical protein
VLLLPMSQAERRFGLARGTLAAVTDGCRRKAVHSYSLTSRIFTHRVGTRNGLSGFECNRLVTVN